MIINAAVRCARRTRRVLLATAATLALLAGACGGDGASSSTTTPVEPTHSGGAVAGSISVLAAASLSDALPVVVEAFEAAHPDADIQVSFSGSSTLAAQIREGAPADLFASADTRTMDMLEDEGLLDGEVQVVATNRLAIIVEPGNPKGITGLADLAAPDLLYVTAAPEVPIARYAQEALGAAGVEVRPVSQESDVKGIVTKVTSGEADAGIVYATDVAAAEDRADGVDLPGLDVVATYPAGVLAEASDPALARAFLAFLTSDAGQAILIRFGFGSV